MLAISIHTEGLLSISKFLLMAFLPEFFPIKREVHQRKILKSYLFFPALLEKIFQVYLWNSNESYSKNFSGSSPTNIFFSKLFEKFSRNSWRNSRKNSQNALEELLRSMDFLQKSPEELLKELLYTFDKICGDIIYKGKNLNKTCEGIL